MSSFARRIGAWNTKFSNTFERDAGGGRATDEVVGLGERDGHGLLQRDVLPGGDGGRGEVVVEVVRGEDLDGVDVVARQQSPGIRVDRAVRHAPVMAPPPGQFEIRVGDRGHGGARVRAVARGMQVGDPPTADDADAEHAHTSRMP
jgi:hypothetical protein